MDLGNVTSLAAMAHGQLQCSADSKHRYFPVEPALIALDAGEGKRVEVLA